VSGNDFPLLLRVTSTDAVRFSFVASCSAPSR
jgi:hypothetical protein